MIVALGVFIIYSGVTVLCLSQSYLTLTPWHSINHQMYYFLNCLLSWTALAIKDCSRRQGGNSVDKHLNLSDELCSLLNKKKLYIYPNLYYKSEDFLDD